MPYQAKHGLLAILTCLALFSSACGPSKASTEAGIATAVALTVEAQKPEPTSTAAATNTPRVVPPGTPTATLASKPTFPPPSGNEQACMKASLVEENVPDGTIMKPGQQFTKTWRIQNASTCTWNTSYKIVFWDGDVMGGGYVYNFPQQALPGDIVDVPLVLTAPSADGTYRSSWKLQTPGGSTFGVGTDSPFWAEIIVSSSTKIEYGVTSVTYSVVRDPAGGCTTNVRYTIYATVTVNGPVTVIYNWKKSDGTTEDKKNIKFTEAGSQTVSMDWLLHLGAATNERWVQLFTLSPVEQDYGKATFTYNCS